MLIEPNELLKDLIDAGFPFELITRAADMVTKETCPILKEINNGKTLYIVIKPMNPTEFQLLICKEEQIKDDNDHLYTDFFKLLKLVAN